MTSADFEDPLSRVVCLADDIEPDADSGLNRRIHERIKANDLRWLRAARVKYGADIRVLDLSAGGMLLETGSQLKPDAQIVVELTAATSILVPSRVIRCKVASFGGELRYQGACAFKRPLTIPELKADGAGRAGGAGGVGDARKAVEATAFSPLAEAGSTWQKVVARFTDGRVLCGYTNNFHPSKPQLHVSQNPRQGQATFVPMSQLKALFFVREFLGDPTFVERKAFVDQPQGRKVEVTFHDHEVLVGSTLGYRGEGSGFFVQPADTRSNNLRIFVSASGVNQVRFLT